MSNSQPNQTLTIATGNEISGGGNILAGFLLVIFTIMPFILIVGMWPNKLPAIGEESAMIYRYEWFNVTLKTSGVKDAQRNNNQKEVKKDVVKKEVLRNNDKGNQTINLNSLIFILVASAGFLGSMIHIASSFTDYIGSNQFRKSWVLWYIVKPFTGASIALVLYFVLRAGLLNVGDSNSINLFGVVTLAALAGLFTDKATLKLEEVFTVLFRPEDKRSGKLEKDKVNVSIKVTDIDPQEILPDSLNNVTIKGEGFDTQKVVLKINDVEVTDIVREPGAIKFAYLVPDELRTGQSITIQLFDESGKEIHKKDILFKKKDEPDVAADPLQTMDDDDSKHNDTEDSIKG